VASDANTSSSLPVGCIGTEFLTLTSNYAFLLVKTNESHVILSNAFPHLEAISHMNYSDSGPDFRWQKFVSCLDFWLQTTQQNSKLRYISLTWSLISKSVCKQTIKYAYNSRLLQCRFYSSKANIAVQIKFVSGAAWFTKPKFEQVRLFYFFWRYSPNLGLGLPPWNSPFHYGFLDLLFSKHN
jgi:hypothetical protein